MLWVTILPFPMLPSSTALLLTIPCPIRRALSEHYRLETFYSRSKIQQSNMSTGNGPWYVIMSNLLCSITNTILLKCLVSDGRPSSEPNARGAYNISIHQSFRLNGSDYYTIFDLPINVSNGIPLNGSSKQDGNNPNPSPRQEAGGRVSCSSLENGMMLYNVMMNATTAMATQPYLGGPVLVGNYGGFIGPKTGVSTRSRSSVGLLSITLVVLHVILFM